MMGGFTPEQVQRRLSLIETPKSGYEKLLGKDIWLLDFGTSCHMTGSLASLCDGYNLKPIPVELLNRSEP